MDGWTERGSNPTTFQFRDHGRLIAEVFPTQAGRWNWYRLTSYMEHGSDPATGTASSLEGAKRQALHNVQLPYSVAGQHG
jgi:hypothetical protein